MTWSVRKPNFLNPTGVVDNPVLQARQADIAYYYGLALESVLSSFVAP